MPINEIELNKGDFDRAKWQEVIAENEEDRVERYQWNLVAKMKEAKEAGDKKQEAVFSLLASLTSMHLDLDRNNQPFSPIYISNYGRSAMLDDISQPEILLLKELIPATRNAKMRARLADVVWFRNRDQRIGAAAVEAYLEATQEFAADGKNWIYAAEQAERALQIARMSRNKELEVKSINLIEDLILQYEERDPFLFVSRLMKALQNTGCGDPLKEGVVAARKAAHYESKLAWTEAWDYRQLQAKWYSMAHEPDQEKEAWRLVAETYVGQSNEALSRNPPSYIAAAAHIQKAIEGLKRVGKSTRARQEELNKLLVDYGQKTQAEMSSYSQSIDISQYVDEAENRVKGKSLEDSFTILAMAERPPQIRILREQAERHLGDQSDLMSLLSAVIIAEDGKVVAKKPDYFTNDPKEKAAALKAEMFEYATRYQMMIADSTIEPIRLWIKANHYVRLTDWLRIVINNPFVPQDRALIFAEGLNAGLYGEFMIAISLLVPQLENSIRYVLRQHNIEPSRVTPKGTQDEDDLNFILYNYEDQLNKIFGEDIIFDLKGLLVERFGSNIRNKTAHGMMSYYHFYSSQAKYLWWLVLHLCFIPMITEQGELDNAAEVE